MSIPEIIDYIGIVSAFFLLSVAMRLAIIEARYADLARKDREARPKPPQWPYCASKRYGHKTAE